MTSIYFVGPYPPIMCGIATYTRFLIEECPSGTCGVLSFDLDKYGAPLTDASDANPNNVWYGIPSRNEYSALDIRKGLSKLEATTKEAVLWFQHEGGIWPNQEMFITMLKTLNIPKFVSFHTLHFQSDETPSGLRKCEHKILKKLLPHVDAIGVFSYGVYLAVISAFPEHCNKINIVKHGVHSYPEIRHLRRTEARAELFDFLMYDSQLSRNKKVFLYENNIFNDPDAVFIGQTGFLCYQKQSEALYFVRSMLQKLIPNKRVIALRIGVAKDNEQKSYAKQLKAGLDDRNAVLLETWLPPEKLPLTQRAFDVNFYWPEDCTQSGVISHALGSGALVAGRDLEGVGETLKEAGQLAETDMVNLILKLKDTIVFPQIAEMMEEQAIKYARRFSWKNQVRSHFDLAEEIKKRVPACRFHSQASRCLDESIPEIPSYAVIK